MKALQNETTFILWFIHPCKVCVDAVCRWLVLAMAMARFYIQKGTHKGLYRSIARTLKFFQTFALVEVRHQMKVDMTGRGGGELTECDLCA